MNDVELEAQDFAFSDLDNNGDDFLSVRQPVTYISLVLYSALFLYIYCQLWLVLKFGYKRWCYRTALLYFSIIWCSLRIVLFSYYGLLEHRAIIDVDDVTVPKQLSRRLGIITYFLLFSFPLFLQFLCLSTLVAYFYQIYRSCGNNFHPSQLSEWRWPSYALCGLNTLVFVVNLTSAVLIKYMDESNHSGKLPDPSDLPLLTAAVVHTRVLLNGITFLTLVGALTYLTIHVSNAPDARLLLETEDLTQCSAVSVCVLLVFVFLGRTIINILAVIPTVNFVLDTDQIDLLSDSHWAYLMFVTVLFLWEFVPTILMVLFFRVKSPYRTPLLLNEFPDSAVQLIADTFSDGSSGDDGFFSQGSHYQHGSFVSLGHGAESLLSPPTSSILNAGSLHRSPSVPAVTANFVSHIPGGINYSAESAEDTVNSSLEACNSPPGTVHCPSTRFHHRVSLFSYNILNRTSRLGI